MYDTFAKIQSQTIYFHKPFNQEYPNFKNCSQYLENPVLEIDILDPLEIEYLELELKKFFPLHKYSRACFQIMPNDESLELLLIIVFDTFIFTKSKKVRKQTFTLDIDLTSRRFMSDAKNLKSSSFRFTSIPLIEEGREGMAHNFIKSCAGLETIKDKENPWANPNSIYINPLPEEAFQDWKKIFRNFEIPKSFQKLNSILDLLLKSKTHLPNELLLIIFSHLEEIKMKEANNYNKNKDIPIWNHHKRTLGEF